MLRLSNRIRIDGCIVAWEILWNDPVSGEEFAAMAGQLRSTGQEAGQLLGGFFHNKKRSTAYFWSPEATENFLRVNGLSHIIRAHEQQPNGYSMTHGGKVATVFSSSRYCNADNAAACALVAHGKIRIIKLSTYVYHSA